MSKGLACPNPQCNYIFPRDELGGAGIITCRSCGARFRLKAPASPDAAALECPDPEPRQRQRGKKRRRLPWGMIAALTVLCVGAAAAVGAGFWLNRQRQSLSTEVAAPAHVSTAFNYRFTYPGPPWEIDDQTRLAMKWSNLVLRKSDAQAWMAIGFKDYRTRNPSVREAQEEGLRRLREVFQELEWSFEGEAPMAGQSARYLAFQGDFQAKPVSGECHILVHQGVAYWFITWAKRDAALGAAAEFEAIRQRFDLLAERARWQGQHAVAQNFHGDKAAYSLRDGEGIWRAVNPRDWDERADLALTALAAGGAATPEEATGLAGRSASVVVLLLAPQDNLADALNAARRYLDDKRKKEGLAQIKSELLDEKDEQLNRIPSRQARFRVQNAGTTYDRFVWLTAIKGRRQTIAIVCEAPWQDHDQGKWDEDFGQLLGSFRME